MKRTFAFSSLLLVCLVASSPAFGQGQTTCQLNLVGTWSPGEGSAILYRFSADGRVAVLSGSGAQAREIATAAYTLDDPKAPTTILIKAAKEGGGLSEGTTAMEITAIDDTALTLVKDGSAPARWVKVDHNRYFMVLAGRSGVFFDQSGPTFPILIKMDGQRPQIDAVGIYAVGSTWAFGPVPAETVNEFMKEPRKDSDVMLRLEINSAQYERGVKIVRTWERRAREGALLYPDLFLDNVLLVKQVTESLNTCGDRIKMYKLDWSLKDHISENNPVSRAPFLYFKELKRLNESLHVRDEQYYGNGHPKQQLSGNEARFK